MGFFDSVATFAIIMAFTYVGWFLVALMNGFTIPFTKKKLPGIFCHFKMPVLTGMIIFGMIGRNINSYMDNYNDDWGYFIRECCLVVILISGGLELSFKDKKILILTLSVLPMIFEAASIAGVSKGIYDLPILLCFSLGFVIGAVSPGVLIPSCMHLHNEGFGVDKDIPTTLIASASFSDIIAIEIFGVFTEFELNKISGRSESMETNILFTFLFIFGGVVSGVICGLGLGFALLKLKHHLNLKAICIVAVLIIFIVIIELTHFYEALFACTLTFAYILHVIWKDDKPQKQMHYVLKFMKPFLFGTIGAAIKLDEIEFSIVPYAIIIVAIGLTIRCFVTYACVWNKKFNLGERLLFVIAWTPKATVQAVLGGLILDWAKKELEDDDPEKDEYETYGYRILTTAVISIFMTAPLGAILTENLGKKWLHKSESKRSAQAVQVATFVPEQEDVRNSEGSSSNSSKESKPTSKEDEDEKEVENKEKAPHVESQEPLKSPSIHEDPVFAKSNPAVDADARENNEINSELSNKQEDKGSG